jgi:hypothetical protein
MFFELKERIKSEARFVAFIGGLVLIAGLLYFEYLRNRNKP